MTGRTKDSHLSEGIFDTNSLSTPYRKEFKEGRKKLYSLPSNFQLKLQWFCICERETTQTSSLIQEVLNTNKQLKIEEKKSTYYRPIAACIH